MREPKVRTLPGSVHPAWHYTNPYLQVEGLVFGVGAVHRKQRRGGYGRPQPQMISSAVRPGVSSASVSAASQTW